MCNRQSCTIALRRHNGAMGIVNRIMLVVILALALQAGAGSAVRANVHAIPVMSEHGYAFVGSDADQQTITKGTGRIAQDAEPTSASDCLNGLCSGSSCQCPCHGLMAALPALPIAFPDVPRLTCQPSSPTDFMTVSLIPPVRPPKI